MMKPNVYISHFSHYKLPCVHHSDSVNRHLVQFFHSLYSASSEWFASESGLVENKISEVHANSQLLKEQVKKAVDDFKQLLDTRLSVSAHSVVWACVYSIQMQIGFDFTACK